ncbi:hypothetical protein D9M70_534300 [compost metagenome]
MHGAPVCLLQEIGDGGGGEIDDLLPDGRFGREACRLAHRLLGPVGIAPAQFGQSSDICHGIIDELRLGSVPNRRLFAAVLAGIAILPLAEHVTADRNRRRRAEVRSRRHRRDVAGIEDIGAGARRARTARRDVARNRHGGSEDRADDLAHRRVETSGRIHLQDHQRKAALFRLRQAAPDIFGRGRADGAVDMQHQGNTIVFGLRRSWKRE